MKSKNNILQALESLGRIFPSDKDAVERFEKKFKKEIKEAAPKHLDDPLAIIQNGLITKITVKNFSELFESEGLAQAAREGSAIPDSIKKKMLEDRKNAKEKR